MLRNSGTIFDTYFASDVLLRQQVLALVVEDHVDFLGAWPADVGAEHDVVRALPVHVLGVQTGRDQLDVASAAVDVLFVLHLELNHQILPLVAERVELGGDRVEPGILGRLDSCKGKQNTGVPVGWIFFFFFIFFFNLN